jgi:excisionase family DNA binding protein
MATETAVAEYLTVDEVARRLRQSSGTIYRKIASGELEAFRLGEFGPLRIPTEAVEAHLRRRPHARAYQASPAGAPWTLQSRAVEPQAHGGDVNDRSEGD